MKTNSPRQKPQRSRTLMRQAVRRPAPGLKRRLNAQSNAGALVEQPAAPVAPKLAFGNTDAERLKHARVIKKSRLITHFNLDANPGAAAYAVPVTVIPSAPAQPAAAPKPLPRQPAPEADDIFERAIQQATSHLEPAHKPARKRRLHLARRHRHARA